MTLPLYPKHSGGRRNRKWKSHKTCLFQNKTRFPSLEEAESRLMQIRRGKEKAGRDGLPCRVYHCDICGDWHLTKKKL